MNRLYAFVISFLFFFLLFVFTQPSEKTLKHVDEKPVTKERTFSHSKRLAEKMYSEYRRTFYCDCPYDEYKQIDLKACEYKSRKNSIRATKMEWEHIVPASYFGRSLTCWRDGGRQACGSQSALFSNFEGDLHNLVPAVGEINGDRGDKIHGEVTNKGFSYGACEFYISGRIATPRPEIKGDVARMWLYMAHKYGMFLTTEMRETFEKWDKSDPVSDYELWRNQKIKEIQGDDNIFITRQRN